MSTEEMEILFYEVLRTIFLKNLPPSGILFKEPIFAVFKYLLKNWNDDLDNFKDVKGLRLIVVNQELQVPPQKEVDNERPRFNPLSFLFVGVLEVPGA